MNINHFCELSEIQSRVFQIAFRLSELNEDDYTNEEAITDLIRVAEEINRQMNFYYFFHQQQNSLNKEG